MSLETAADWLDYIKQVHRYDHIRPWHYVNIDKDKTYVETKKPNVINQSVFAITELSNKQNNWTNRHFCLKVVLHLIADLHMPLHVGFGEDRGGNDFKLTHNNFETNLHYLWDETIISDFNIDTKECLKIASGYSREKIKAIQSGDILSWANESRSYLSAAYNLKEGKTDKTYMKNSAQIIRELLVRAGLRLAHILNKAFS